MHPSSQATTPIVNRTPPDTVERLGEPGEKLDPRAKQVWMIGDLFGALVLGLMVFVASSVARWILDIHWGWAAAITGGVVALNLAWAVLSPPIRYNQWRYEIREDEVDLLHGLVVKTRQIVPMSRIQHVDTTRGPIQRRFGLSSVVFYTAAGSMTIPELSVDRAADVRDQIAALARVRDDL